MKLAVSVVILLVAAAANAQPIEQAAATPDVVPEIKSIIDVLTVSGDQAGATREKRQFGGALV